MSELFKDIIPSILQTKKDCLVDEKDYKPFLVNKALSFHYDCIMYANQMNLNTNLDPYLQYQYLLHSIRAYKRPFQKWHKKQIDDNVKIIKEYYNCSNEKASLYLKVLSKDEIKELSKKLCKGGLKK